MSTMSTELHGLTTQSCWRLLSPRAPVVAAADAVAHGDYVAAADAVAVAAGQSEPRLIKMFGESPVQFAAALG